MAVSAAILAHAPAAFLSLKSPLNRNRPRDKNRTKNAEKPPFQAVFLRKMSFAAEKDTARKALRLNGFRVLHNLYFCFSALFSSH
ncbi:MAG: hypothetical protein KH338_10870, partial [Oscillospiraceae bacterium]|nr:hypothetical protein [Oscillospiraceae bacterium]